MDNEKLTKVLTKKQQKKLLSLEKNGEGRFFFEIGGVTIVVVDDSHGEKACYLIGEDKKGHYVPKIERTKGNIWFHPTEKSKDIPDPSVSEEEFKDSLTDEDQNYLLNLFDNYKASEDIKVEKKQKNVVIDSNFIDIKQDSVEELKKKEEENEMDKNENMPGDMPKVNMKKEEIRDGKYKILVDKNNQPLYLGDNPLYWHNVTVYKLDEQGLHEVDIDLSEEFPGWNIGDTELEFKDGKIVKKINIDTELSYDKPLPREEKEERRLYEENRPKISSREILKELEDSGLTWFKNKQRQYIETAIGDVGIAAIRYKEELEKAKYTTAELQDKVKSYKEELSNSNYSPEEIDAKVEDYVIEFSKKYKYTEDEIKAKVESYIEDNLSKKLEGIFHSEALFNLGDIIAKPSYLLMRRIYGDQGIPNRLVSPFEPKDSHEETYNATINANVKELKAISDGRKKELNKFINYVIGTWSQSDWNMEKIESLASASAKNILLKNDHSANLTEHIDENKQKVYTEIIKQEILDRVLKKWPLQLKSESVEQPIYCKFGNKIESAYLLTKTVELSNEKTKTERKLLLNNGKTRNVSPKLQATIVDSNFHPITIIENEIIIDENVVDEEVKNWAEAQNPVINETNEEIEDQSFIAETPAADGTPTEEESTDEENAEENVNDGEAPEESEEENQDRNDESAEESAAEETAESKTKKSHPILKGVLIGATVLAAAAAGAGFAKACFTSASNDTVSGNTVVGNDEAAAAVEDAISSKYTPKDGYTYEMIEDLNGNYDTGVAYAYGTDNTDGSHDYLYTVSYDATAESKLDAIANGSVTEAEEISHLVGDVKQRATNNLAKRIPGYEGTDVTGEMYVKSCEGTGESDVYGNAGYQAIGQILVRDVNEKALGVYGVTGCTAFKAPDNTKEEAIKRSLGYSDACNKTGEIKFGDVTPIAGTQYAFVAPDQGKGKE